jgi:hypothetical protein
MYAAKPTIPEEINESTGNTTNKVATIARYARTPLFAHSLSINAI